MLVPDLDIGRRFVDSNCPPGRTLLCGVTGAHHYGFPSPDSDLDLKGIFLAPTRSLLGLETVKETIDKLQIFEDVECDMTLHEAHKALKLLIGGNGNMLERILSPYQLYATDDQKELARLAKGALSKRFFGHYRGYFNGMCREAESQQEPTAKKMLYSYRVALTGIHLLTAGELEGNIDRTAKAYGFASVLELVAFKRENTEKSALPPALFDKHKARWGELETMLHVARDKSELPDTPGNISEISDWLRTQRLQEL